MTSAKDLTEDYIVISINDTGYNTVIYDNEHIIDKLKLWFDDIDKEIVNCTIAKKSDLLEIKNFIDKYKDSVNNIVIHCTAGISRSGAVGCVLARYLNGDDGYLLATGKYIPNEYVYKMMCEVFELEYSKKMFKEKLKIRNKGDRSRLKKVYGVYGVNIDDVFCDVIVGGEKMKINKYKLKENISVNEILDNGFGYSLDKKYLTKYKTLHNSITLTIKIPLSDIHSFDFQKDIDILDEDSLQPYSPFYTNCEKSIAKFPFLEKVIERYNGEMNKISIFERL